MTSKLNNYIIVFRYSLFIIQSKFQNITMVFDVFFRYDAIFYTGGQFNNEHSLKKYLLPYGSYVSTIPEYLASDSLGYVSGSLFSGCIRIRLLFQVRCQPTDNCINLSKLLTKFFFAVYFRCQYLSLERRV